METGAKKENEPIGWSVNNLSIGDPYDKTIKEKGRPTTDMDIQGRLVAHYYYEGKKLVLWISFGARFLVDGISENEYEPSVVYLKGIELTGPGGILLRDHDSTEKVTEVLGEPDEIRRHQLDEDSFWTYSKGEYIIDIHIRRDKVLTFHLAKFVPSNDQEGFWM